MLQAARAEHRAVADVAADEVFELVLALSWAIDRYGDTEEMARRRVQLGTAGVFVQPDLQGER
nr:hypothetical protein [Devosia sp. 1566]